MESMALAFSAEGLILFNRFKSLNGTGRLKPLLGGFSHQARLVSSLSLKFAISKFG
jgi:hypothetical protein